uniref:GIY-YIG catalytic domain-containing protein n=1 Tax=Candidatus Kentrum sp. FW TaxID=2126338 RepID=A0A450TUU2_9GAMM|nr:MAG: GIY-YIG catalytic domain-containing protein [Candidatus Kentron sp. FW]
MLVGVTGDLPRRIYEHKNKLVDGFTKKYNVNKSVYFEETSDVNATIMREKEIKKWRRERRGLAKIYYHSVVQRIRINCARNEPQFIRLLDKLWGYMCWRR